MTESSDLDPGSGHADLGTGGLFQCFVGSNTGVVDDRSLEEGSSFFILAAVCLLLLLLSPLHLEGSVTGDMLDYGL